MLRITQQDSASGAKRYYASADYYSEGQEIIGSWGGRGARMLRLDGVVDRPSFDRLCDNCNPFDGQKLTVRSRSERTVGYDFTWSVPKSVSVLYALTGDREILEAFRNAVDATMRDIEAEMQTRVRRGRKDEDRTTGNMIWAEFIHTTSRPVDGVPDPQLHAHCFVFNATWDDQERRFKAGQFRGLKADAPYFQAAFRARLAGNLQELGFGIVRKRDDFEIAGIPTAVLKRFSRRTEVIEKAAAERGISDPERKAELGAQTREKKTHELSWDQLRKEWDSRLTDDERAALAAAHRREVPYARPGPGEGQAVNYALEHCFTREAAVPERKLLTEALKRGLGQVTVEGVTRELSRRPLIRGVRGGKAMATTREMKAAEGQVIAFARDGRGRCRPLGDPARPCRREWLNAEQQAAVRHVLSSRDRVMIIRGAAGTGKTTLELELGDVFGEARLPVVALAQSTGAVEELREQAGFAQAATVARFFRDEQMQASVFGGIILVDEASQQGTRDMLRLFTIARDAGARIVLVGDRRQHRSVAAGEPLRLLEEHAGLPVAEVTQILRQTHDEYRRASHALSEGRAADAFAELDRLGWIREVPDSERYLALARAYLGTIRETKKNGDHKSCLVVTPTHAEAARITAALRAALREQGKLGEERTLAIWRPAQLTDAEKADATQYEAGDMLQFHQNAPGHPNGSRLIAAEGQGPPVRYAGRFEVYRPAQLTLAPGDRIRVTVNGWTKDGKHKLSNGALLTVQGFTPQGDLVVDRGWVIARDFGHLAYGYAVTSHASQGKTVDKVVIGQSSQSFPASNRRQFYVSVSRGKEQTLVFTDNKQELLKAVQRADQPLSATELAESRPGQPALRQRLQKLLAFRRRQATFAQTNEPRSHESQRTPTSQREMGHER